MRYTKLSVTLESGVADELRRIAGARGVSAFVNAAVRQHLQESRLRKMLDEMDSEAVPIPDAIRQDVEAHQWPD